MKDNSDFYFGQAMMCLGMLMIFALGSPLTSSHSFISAAHSSPFVEHGDTITLAHTVTVGHFFRTMDSLITDYNYFRKDSLTEHLLVHANPWLIDSLSATDYYLKKTRGLLVLDQRNEIIIRAGDRIELPDSLQTAKIKRKLDSIRLDINVPEFKLRIFLGDSCISEFPVRVGQHRYRFLKLVGRKVNLQTNLGSGHIIRHVREPYFINPVDGMHFTQTKRDDGLITEMPLIPWIETELNGIRTGDMIHPTTNPVTLGKAWSNGCIGLKEADAWKVYYYAPIGTPIRIRYDLNVVDSLGNSVLLKDIYHLKQVRKQG